MNTSKPAGYSGTPLAKKLGYRESSRVFVIDAPADYAVLVQPLPPGLVFEGRVSAGTDIVHLFVTEKAELARRLAALRKQLKPEASIWVSWPKKSSAVATTVTEGTIRELALALGLVDIKVCAVNDTWSGLKLVVRKALR
jgi:hypothetical protein